VIDITADETTTEAGAGHGISFDLDFGGGASATGGYHVHLSGLDEMSAEQLIDHLSHPVAAAPAATTGQHMTDTSFGQGTAAPVHLPAVDAALHRVPGKGRAGTAGNHPLSWTFVIELSLRSAARTLSKYRPGLQLFAHLRVLYM
jgi:hypothetical protein